MSGKKEKGLKGITRPSSSDRLIDRIKKDKYSDDKTTSSSSLKVEDPVKRQRSASIPRLKLNLKGSGDIFGNRLKVSDAIRKSDTELSKSKTPSSFPLKRKSYDASAHRKPIDICSNNKEKDKESFPLRSRYDIGPRAPGTKESKLVILGAGGVGKTSLVLQFLQGVFSTTYKPTVEDCYNHTLQLPSKFHIARFSDHFFISYF